MPPRFAPSKLTLTEWDQCSCVYYPPELTGRMRNHYWSSRSYIDNLLAKTVDLLRRQNLLDNTVPISPMTLLGIGPMILDLAGIPAYPGFQGQIPPQLRSATDDPSRPIFSTIQNLDF